ncbi:MAG: hypothetical protein KIT72_07910 [Polyangiaceae bacterium]|nr:hypothetical protein [Polyangiaceae bacterium]
MGPCDGVSCGSDQYCDPSDAQCHCLPGWTASGGSCTPNLPGDPLAHTEAQVCDMWRWGQTVTDSSPWTSGGSQCDPGTLSRAGLNDTVRRLNMFRWLVGLGPTADEASRNETNRWCAVLASWNPPGTVPDAHHPPPGSTCYTETGLAGTSSSNLAWGSGHPANAIDQFVEDWGVPSLGHRRWIFNPPLGPVGIGYYGGGGSYGNAQCLGVFSSSFSFPSPQWTSWPPPGYSPSAAFRWPWSFHYRGSLSGATVRVVRDSDGQEMSVTTENLTGGYGSYTTLSISISPAPSVSETYTVTVTTSSEVITYPLRPVSC